MLAYLLPLYGSHLSEFHTFAIEFSLAFASAKSELHVSNFTHHFLSCLHIYKRAHLQNVDFADAMLDPSNTKEIMKMIHLECNQGVLPVVNRDL